MLAPSKKPILCDHCQSPIKSSDLIREKNYSFCCSGCQTIFKTLKQNGLENFYEIMKSESKKANQANISNQYAYLTDNDFLNDFAQDKDKKNFHFYVDGLECLACSWVMQNLQKVSDNISYVSFSVEKNILEVRIINSQALKDIAAFISGLGYKLIPLKNIEQAENQLNKEKISQIKRIGITGAILMNMMIYSISIYAGADGWFKQFFGHVQAALYLPIFLYSASPFYKGLLTQIKNKSFTIDLPLNLSILCGSLLSYYNYFQGSDVYYFDSLTMFIFLILSTRFFLYYLYRREISQKFFDGIYTSQQVQLIFNGKKAAKHISRIRHQDLIAIATNEVVPLDGFLKSDQAYLNESLITGESAPVLKRKGDQILSGSQNLSKEMQIEVTSTSKDNSFHHYLNALSFDLGQIERYSKIGNKYSMFLTSTILFIASALLFTSTGQMNQANIDKVLALLIVCCPCALGIGIPLASILKIKSLAKKGILIRKNTIIEEFSEIKTLNFDKTGTLTTGNFLVKSIEGNQNAFPIMLALEKHSQHPIAKFITKYFQKHDRQLDLNDYKEIPGIGPEAFYEGHHYAIRSNEENQTILLQDGEEHLSLTLEEESVPNLSEKLKVFSQRYLLNIISGDTQKKMDHFKENLLEIPNLNFFSNQKPKEKEALLKKSKNSVYVGDGLNDVHALKAANISISLNASQLVDDVSDVVFLGGGLEKLNTFFDELKQLDKVLSSNILLSILYNTIAIYLVLSGAITPFAAAVLMPISSLIVVLHSYLREVA